MRAVLRTSGPIRSIAFILSMCVALSYNYAVCIDCFYHQGTPNGRFLCETVKCDGWNDCAVALPTLCLLLGECYNPDCRTAKGPKVEAQTWILSFPGGSTTHFPTVVSTKSLSETVEAIAATAGVPTTAVQLKGAMFAIASNDFNGSADHGVKIDSSGFVLRTDSLGEATELVTVCGYLPGGSLSIQASQSVTSGDTLLATLPTLGPATAVIAITVNAVDIAPDDSSLIALQNAFFDEASAWGFSGGSAFTQDAAPGGCVP